MDSSSASDATRKRVVLAVDDKLKVYDMVPKKVPQSPKPCKREFSTSWTNGMCLFGAVPFYTLIYV